MVHMYICMYIYVVCNCFAAVRHRSLLKHKVSIIPHKYYSFNSAPSDITHRDNKDVILCCLKHVIE